MTKREVAFRGKAVDGITINDVENAWVFGDFIHYAKDEVYIMSKNYKCWDVTHDGTRVIPETVGQFTGLYAGVFNSLCGDKEYDEIYEGDKISVTYATQGMSNSHEHTITGVVAFKNGSFVVEWDFPNKGKYRYQTLNSIKRLGDCGVVIKIIGNIHDNPEFIQGTT